MSETLLTSYEEVPYLSKPLYPTHPDCLATVATLMGMRPAPVPRCRVLELGCATGGNLIPMAATLPDSRFVGIDLSPRQIAMGQEVVQALGLTNIDLRALSILDVPAEIGTFDYIICHGVYSWVPREVQDRILALCQRLLTPHGVAYLSYNTYPGWHSRALVRDMMQFHVGQFADAQVRVQQARAFLAFLVEAVPNPDSTYGRLLKEEADLLQPQADSYLFHEHLEEVNHPVYFWQFIERAASHGLQFLGEAWFHSTLGTYPPHVQETLQHVSADLVHLEQYLDFLTNRTFRRTLLCRADVALDRTPSAEVLLSLHASALARPQAAQACLDAETETFQGDEGQTIATNIPLVKAALRCLYEAWPRALSCSSLWSAVEARLGTNLEAETRIKAPQLLAATLLQCYLSGLVALHVHPAQFVLEIGARPVASPLARLQAASSSAVTNLRHRLVSLTDFDRAVLRLLDGSRDRTALRNALAEPTSEDALSASLQKIAGSALLVG